MEEQKINWKQWRVRLIAVRNKVKRCPLCGNNIEDRTVTIYKDLVNDLYKVYKHCKQAGVYTFKMRDVKYLMSKNNYARFGDLSRFGDLVYKYAKGNYGLNMDKCLAFFKGIYKIPVQITINQITNEIVEKHEVDIQHFPELWQMLNGEGVYDNKKRLF